MAEPKQENAIRVTVIAAAHYADFQMAELEKLLREYGDRIKASAAANAACMNGREIAELNAAKHEAKADVLAHVKSILDIAEADAMHAAIIASAKS